MKLKKFNEHKDLDPFNEENWDDEAEIKRDLVERCSYNIIENAYDYKHYLLDILKEHFNNKTIEELKEFLGEREEEFDMDRDDFYQIDY